jgi:hypothetical protein
LPAVSPICRAEFVKLWDDEKKGRAAVQAAGQRKVEERCADITAYTTVAWKFVKWAKTCGLPVQIVQQLKEAHSNTEKTKERICSPVFDLPGFRLPRPKLPSPRLHIAV